MSNAQRLVALKAKIEECIGESLSLENQMDEFTSMRRLWERNITLRLADASDFIETLEKRKAELGLN